MRREESATFEENQAGVLGGNGTGNRKPKITQELCGAMEEADTDDTGVRGIKLQTHTKTRR